MSAWLKKSVRFFFLEVILFFIHRSSHYATRYQLSQHIQVYGLPSTELKHAFLFYPSFDWGNSKSSFFASTGADHPALQTIDITVGPTANGSTTPSNQTPISPPQYSLSLSFAPRAAAPPYASTSSARRPSLPPGIRPYDLLPTQLQREFSPVSETEPESEDELKLPLRESNKLVRLLFLPIC